MRFGVLAPARGTFDVDAAAAVTERALRRLRTWAPRDEVVGGESLAIEGDHAAAVEALADLEPDVVVLAQATFTSTAPLDELIERCPAPVVLWGFPEPDGSDRLLLNSLCGITLASHRLRARGHPGGWWYGNPDDAGARRGVDDAVRAACGGTGRRPGPELLRPARAPHPALRDLAARLASRVAGARIGRIGGPPPGFGADVSATSPLTAHLGVAVDERPVDALFVEADGVSRHAVEAARRRMARTADGLDELSPTAVDHGVRLELALRSLVGRHRWAGVAARCLPECAAEYGTTICTALGMVAERGIPAGCEADVLGTVTNVVLAELSARPPYLADLVAIDRSAGTGTFWHCGVAAPSLARPGAPVAVTVHPNRRMGIANDFELAPGRVTIARITERPGGELALVLGAGEIEDRPHVLRGTTAVVRFDRPAASVLDRLVGGGLDHHLSLAYGDHTAALEALAHHWGLGIIDL